jgi:hypothetical protein
MDSIRRGSLDETNRILEGAVRAARRDWKAFQRSAPTEIVYCCTSEEFAAYSDYLSHAGA